MSPIVGVVMQKGIIITLIHLRHPNMAKKFFVTYLQKVGVALLEDDFAKNIFLNESKK